MGVNTPPTPHPRGVCWVGFWRGTPPLVGGCVVGYTPLNIPPKIPPHCPTPCNGMADMMPTKKNMVGRVPTCFSWLGHISHGRNGVPVRPSVGRPADPMGAPCGRPWCALRAPAERRLSPPLRGVVGWPSNGHPSRIPVMIMLSRE